MSWEEKLGVKKLVSVSANFTPIIKAREEADEDDKNLKTIAGVGKDDNNLETNLA